MPASAGIPHVFVHGDCADGLTSAGLLKRKLPDAKIHYTHPTELRLVLERVAHRGDATRIVLADLSPQAADVVAIASLLSGPFAGLPRTWIDHHDPQWPVAVHDAIGRTGTEILLDRTGTESGASLSARWTGEKDPGLLRVADLIRKRDAWVDPHDAAARAWTLLATARDAAYVDALANNRLAGLEEEGQRLLASEEAHIAALRQRLERPAPSVAVLWGEDDISDLADRAFAEDSRLVFVLRFGPSGRVSIRTRPGKPLAAPLAQRFGGGGHANAAGFTLTKGSARRWWLRLRKTADSSVRSVVEEARAAAATPGA